MKPGQKYLLIGIAALLVITGAAWRLSGASITDTVKQYILHTAANSINGSLTVGEMDFSLSGSFVAQKVEIKDITGALVASAQTLSIDIDLTDLLARRFDIGRVRKISLDGLVLNFSRDKDAHWNTSEILKKNLPVLPSAIPPAPPEIFRGQVVLSNATVTVSTTDIHYEFKKINGTLDHAKYPDISMDLKANEGSAELTAKGTWNFTGGGNVAMSVSGAEPASFEPNIPLKGPVTAAFTVQGTNDKPTAKGSFKVPACALGNIAFSDAAGEFSLADGTLSLIGAHMNALGGSISNSGSISLDSLRYSQRVVGQNIDSSQLSDKDIHGKIQFTADVEGQNSWDGASADGSFNMGAGSVAGVTFEALTGNFAKQGGNTRYYNLRVTIAGQVIYIGDADSLNALPTLFRDLEILRNPLLQKVPVVPGVPGLPNIPGLPRLF